MLMLGAWGAQGNPGVLTEGAGCVWFWGSSPADKSAKLVEMRLVWLGDPIPQFFPRTVATKAAGNCRTQITG